MPRYMLRLAYDGTCFHGWQKQAAAIESPSGDQGPPLRTVQGVVEEAARAVVREPVGVVGASRTDAGVHARGQVAAFSASAEIEPRRLAAALNARLPDDAQVREARIVDEGFNPIRDAIAKGYRYSIAYRRGGLPPGHPPPLFGRFITFWTPYDLDPVRMNEAARRLIGTHDFASFARKHHGRESSVRTVHDCRVTDRGRKRCRMDICGDGFLHNMVRIIAGTLLEIGRGKREVAAIEEILAAADRTAAGQVPFRIAPPNHDFQRLCRLLSASWIR